jgi:cytochrome b561
MTWGATSKLFHWAGAALIFYLLIHGFWMVTFPAREARFGHYEAHAAVGYALIALTLLRLAWRWTHAVPALVGDNSLHGALEQAHALLSWALALFVVVHIASAFYHLAWRKDDVMQRMLP